jgi:hypothetical protein
MFPWKSEALGDLSSLSDMKMLWSFDSSGKYGTFSALQILVFLELSCLLAHTCYSKQLEDKRK